MSTYPPTDSRRAGARRRGRGLWLLIVAALLAVAVIVALPRVTSFLSDYFAANGTWYGPMQVQAGPGRGSIETYMDLTTLPTGSITGTGQFCLPNPIGGDTTTADFGVAGQRESNGSFTLTVSYAVSAPLGLRLLLGPNLQLHGPIAGGVFHLTGGSGNVPASLDMRHGTKAAFTAACHALAPIG
jgi:hypothetical protein